MLSIFLRENNRWNEEDGKGTAPKRCYIIPCIHIASVANVRNAFLLTMLHFTYCKLLLWYSDDRFCFSNCYLILVLRVVFKGESPFDWARVFIGWLRFYAVKLRNNTLNFCISIHFAGSSWRKGYSLRRSLRFRQIEEFKYIFKFIMLLLELVKSTALHFLFGSNLFLEGSGLFCSRTLPRWWLSHQPLHKSQFPLHLLF